MKHVSWFLAVVMIVNAVIMGPVSIPGAILSAYAAPLAENTAESTKETAAESTGDSTEADGVEGEDSGNTGVEVQELAAEVDYEEPEIVGLETVEPEAGEESFIGGDLPLPYEIDDSSVLLDPDYRGAEKESGPGRVRNSGGTEPSADDSSYIPDASALPELRYQGYNGTCWAYGALAMVEMDLVKGGYADVDSVDLSEMHTVYFTHRYNQKGADPLNMTAGDKSDMKLDEGGSSVYGAQAMANWTGAVPQDLLDRAEDVSLEAVDNGTQTLDYTHEHQYLNDSVHIQGIYAIPVSDNSLLKQHILEHGAVQLSYREISGTSAVSTYYNSEHNCYYYPSASTSNHAVAAVGWDDNFSREYFNTSPASNGAWLVRNSWTEDPDSEGTNTHNGYFWISYCDQGIRTLAYSVDAELSDNYDNNYQYDGGIAFARTSLGYSSSSTTGGNVFTVSANSGGDEILKAVSFETYSTVNADYTIQIYKGLTDMSKPNSGTLAAEQSGSYDCNGYYTVSLDNAVELEAGDTFAVVVTLSKDGAKPRIACDASLVSDDWNIETTAESGVSFLMYPSNPDSWYDVSKNNSVFRIKAFTDNVSSGDVTEVTSVTLDEERLDLEVGESAALTASVLPENAADGEVSWNVADELVAGIEVSEDTKSATVTALSAGETVITAASGGKTAECAVSVNESSNTEVTGISLNCARMELCEGDYDILTAAVTPENATDGEISWSVADESVAGIEVSEDGESATVSALSAGETVITAAAGGKTAECVVVVSEPCIEVTGISLNCARMELCEGEYNILTAAVTPEDASDEEVTWSVADESVAGIEVLEDGRSATVFALSAGETVITAAAG